MFEVRPQSPQKEKKKKKLFVDVLGERKIKYTYNLTFIDIPFTTAFPNNYIHHLSLTLLKMIPSKKFTHQK